MQGCRWVPVWNKISSKDNKYSKHAYGLDFGPSTARKLFYTCEYFRKGLCPSRKRWLVPKSQAVNVIHANGVNRSSVYLLYLPISPKSCHILSREHFKYLDSFTVRVNQRVLTYIPHIFRIHHCELYPIQAPPGTPTLLIKVP